MAAIAPIEDCGIRERAPMRVEWVHTSQLFVDREVLVNPRMPEDREPHLRKIAREFDWNKLRVPTVVSRGINQSTGLECFAILDGAGGIHILTVILPQYKDFLIPVHVCDSRVRSRAQESDIFLSQRNNKNITAIDFFVAELNAKDPEAIGIRDTLAKIGMPGPSNKPGPNKKSTANVPAWPNGFDKVSVARALYREGDLSRTLLLARASWQKEPAGPALTAVAILLRAYPNLDEERLRKVLTENSPAELITELKMQRGKLHLYSKGEILAHKYLDLYDRDFRGKLLGGTREGSRAAKGGRYIPGPRLELTAAANALISTWKLTSQPARKKKA